MKKWLHRGALSLISASYALLSFGLPMAHAQTPAASSNGFRISPVRSEFTLDKGKSDTLTITLENPSDGPTVGTAVVNNFVAANDETGEPRLILDDNTPAPKNDFRRLVGAVPDVTLGPREKKDIDIKISIPADANSGGYYGAVRFVPNTPANDKNVGLTASVGTIVLVRVPGNLTERMDLVELSAGQKTKVKDIDTYKSKSFFTSGNVAVITRLKNSGDIHVQPFGKVVIKNMFGDTVQTLEFNNTDPRSNILPDSIRKFSNDLENRKWFGRYTIEINLGYSQGSGDLISSKATFWYIPTYALYAILLGIIGIVTGAYWYIRKQKARRQHKHDVNKKKNYSR